MPCSHCHVRRGPAAGPPRRSGVTPGLCAGLCCPALCQLPAGRSRGQGQSGPQPARASQGHREGALRATIRITTRLPLSPCSVHSQLPSRPPHSVHLHPLPAPPKLPWSSLLCPLSVHLRPLPAPIQYPMTSPTLCLLPTPVQAHGPAPTLRTLLTHSPRSETACLCVTTLLSGVHRGDNGQEGGDTPAPPRSGEHAGKRHPP